MEWPLEVVTVPVADVDRAKRFYSEQLGCIVDHDTRLSSAMRVVQLTPPGSGCSIVVSTVLDGSPPGSLRGLQLVVAGREMEVSDIQHFPDGNAWAVQERPAARG